MKNIMFIFLLLLAACGGDADQGAVDKVALYDALSRNVPGDSSSTIMLTTPDEPQVTLHRGKICLEIPSVERAPQVKFFTIELQIEGDSVSFFSCNASTAKPTSSKHTSTADIIQPGDSKTKIAQRLGIHPSRIKNQEPLKIGQKIRIE